MFRFALHLAVAVGLLWGLHYGPGGIAPLGNLIDPAYGLYHNARIAEHDSKKVKAVSALTGSVTIERDERGVPHIFATSDRDAIVALGYVTAQDRLFQMDFISRVAAGRMSEVFGPSSIEADKYLRTTGMNWAAKQITQAHAQEKSLDYDLMTWFSEGVNAYIHSLSDAEWPFEFKLFGYAPEKHTPLNSVLLMQYFNFDLSFGSDEMAYGLAQDRLSPEDYAELYPRHATRYKPIIPSEATASKKSLSELGNASMVSLDALALLKRMQKTLRDHGIEGYRPSKGSNNWAVMGDRSATGSPILAGDIHLALTLPSIWYEAHLVTPSMNTYGVLSPGTPLLIEAFNDHVSWTYTNSGLDGIDHYLLRLSKDERSYEFDGGWMPLQMLPDTIRVKGKQAIVDTLVLSHLGPVVRDSSAAVAIKWVAHEKNYMMTVLWEMNRAEDAAQLDSALHNWHSPAMNTLYADAGGTVGIRVAGIAPLRGSGHGVGFLDGSTSSTEWTGNIPFEEMPSAVNPAHGYLTSTNQQPTTADYPYYLNHDWQAAYRSLRIDTLLSGKKQHSIEDIKNYQADFYVGQYDAFVPLLNSVRSLSPQAEVVRSALTEWDGFAEGETTGPLALHEYLIALKHLTWDEPVFVDLPVPSETVLLTLLDRGSKWLDIQGTPAIEDAEALMAAALEEASSALLSQYGDDWKWTSHHRVIFRHLTQTPALDMLWRGPYIYPGYDETLGPGDGLEVTHSASWRVVVDFSSSPPEGIGIYAGGQSGNPLSRYYDLQIQDYLNYNYYPLHKPRKSGHLESVSSIFTLEEQ